MAGGLEGDRLAAARTLYQRMVGRPAMEKFKDFAQRWIGRVTDTGGVQTKKPSGRPPKLPQRLVMMVATEWTQKGVGTGARHRPYLSMEEVRAAGRAAATRHVSARCRHLGSVRPAA